VDVGAELFAMSAVCVYASTLVERNPGDRTPLRLADLFCRQARKRIANSFRNTFSNHDRFAYRLAQDVLAGKYTWLEHTIAD